MKYTEKAIGNITVIELKGDVLGGPDASVLTSRLRELVKEEKTGIVLDLRDVEYMNSSGLGMMTTALATVKKAGGALKLANPAERIRSLLVITKLVTLFDAYDSVDEAIASFKN
ncbi:MAG: STAS domain-containing protein [Chlorobiales bacterium]|jgi:anti-sigma B factor antagonist|nr:STAS domain-containing protein [Chlorobiales bacterium]